MVNRLAIQVTVASEVVEELTLGHLSCVAGQLPVREGSFPARVVLVAAAACALSGAP